MRLLARPPLQLQRGHNCPALYYGVRPPAARQSQLQLIAPASAAGYAYYQAVHGCMLLRVAHRT